MYLVKSPWWLRTLYPSLTWKVATNTNTLYLTFDDGPHPTATPFVLNVLQQYNAKATFFCIGKNVVQYPAIYQQIIDAGHTVGNHTFDHLNGWKTKDDQYLNNVSATQQVVDSNLFRPPYGRIRFCQVRKLQPQYKIIMWHVLSADFDTSLTGQQCYNNTIKNSKAGSIIVFHDSAKAYDRLSYALPLMLEYFTAKGFVFKALQ